jgi:curved DNA-binding protein CbpA
VPTDAWFPMRCGPVARIAALSLLAAALLLSWRRLARPSLPVAACDAPPSGGDPYAILGVPHDASREAVVRAYRSLARRWHPDRHPGGGVGEAAAVFATIAHAYEVLTDPERRDVFDRLGEAGLERHRDGDPSVAKDWLPPDEVLRRIHDDGEEEWLESLVTGGFAALAHFVVDCERRLAPMTLWLFGPRLPSVSISATDDGGAALASGGSASAGVTFKFSLSGKSFDFDATDVVHDNCSHPKFLGMKTTFYLQCAHVPGTIVSVRVEADAFTVTDRRGRNQASESFVLEML